MDSETAKEVYDGSYTSDVLKRWLAQHGERLDEAATRHLPSDGEPVTIDLSTPPSKGDTMASWTDHNATDKQINYLNVLLGESAKLQKALLDKGIDHADELMTQTEVVVTAAKKRVDEGTFTKGNAAQAIDFVVDMNRKLKARLRTFRDGTDTIIGRETRARVTEDGMYRTPTGIIFKVQQAKQGSGHLYAKRLVIDTPAETNDYGKVTAPAKGHFEYDRGAIGRLRPEWKMSVDDAKGFGKLYGMCCVCAADLTDDQSIAEGIGPVCGKRMTKIPPTVEVPDSTKQLELELDDSGPTE